MPHAGLPSLMSLSLFIARHTTIILRRYVTVVWGSSPLTIILPGPNTSHVPAVLAVFLVLSLPILSPVLTVNEIQPPAFLSSVSSRMAGLRMYTGTYHVAMTGSDSNPGTSERPWRTIQHAADALSPGNIVYVHDGVYTESVLISHSGSSGNPITFAAYPGENTALDGSGSEWAGFIIDQGVSYIVLDGFQLRNYSDTGVDVRGTNTYVTLSELDISRASTGIRITWGDSGDEPMFGSADHITVRDTHIHDNGLAGSRLHPRPL